MQDPAWFVANNTPLLILLSIVSQTGPVPNGRESLLESTVFYLVAIAFTLCILCPPLYCTRFLSLLFLTVQEGIHQFPFSFSIQFAPNSLPFVRKDLALNIGIFRDRRGQPKSVRELRVVANLLPVHSRLHCLQGL